MEEKKGLFTALIRDAISSMDLRGDSQKAINIQSDADSLLNEKMINAQRGSFDDDFRIKNNHQIDNEDPIKWFSELSNKDIKSAGGKGASLGEMFNHKFPVPPGFVITAQAFDNYMIKAGIKEKIKNILEQINMEDTEELTKASKEIRKLIEEGKMSKELEKDILEAYHILGTEEIDETGISSDALNILKNSHEPLFVSVRSSATTEDLADASFAGQQESFLNVKGDCQLIEKIKKCFSSLYTPRAIYYRKNKGFKEGESLLATVVQKMVDSEKSGVVFSRNPVGSKENIVVEAVFGLGEGIVSGKIKPDHYVVARDLEIKDMKTSDKKIAIVRTGSGENEYVRLSPEKSKSQVLSRGEIKEIADYAIKLESHYNKPQDIEFAFEAGELYILQSRPITTLGGKTEEGKVLSGNVILEGQSASPGVGVGTVKIIKSMEDLPKIKKGDVMVTEMTNPDMVVAMQKSAAIVTDEGGMTCFSEDTKVLTNKGFMNIKDATELVNSGDEIILLAYDSKDMKPIWKKVIAAGKRKSKVIRASISQTGKIEDNTLDLTPDHKMITFENRGLIKKEMESIISNNEHLCLIDTLPAVKKMNNEKLAYLMGAILSDGSINIDMHHTGNPRRGRVTFTQKDVPEKQEFVNVVKSYFEECFGESFSEGRLKFASSNIQGRFVQGDATDYISYKLKPALEISKISQNLDSWIMRLDNISCLNFLAGLIDGDGCFYNNRLHIYINKENVLQGVILACLNLGIFPQITRNRNIHHVQILERLDEILGCTKRVKGDAQLKILGNKLFSAKQILGDIIDDVNFKGRIKPYVDNNLLIDSRKIKRDILDISSEKNKEELSKVLQSGLRMQRVKKVCDIGEIDVYNLEIEANNELDRNFVVFTKKYTPLLVSNSHAAIVSREMGIPCIVGTETATSTLKDGVRVTVDGSSGKVYEGEVAETKTVEIRPAVETEKIKLKVIVDLPDFASRAAETGIKDVGLTRLEGIIASMRKHPLLYEKEGKLDDYSKIIEDGLSKIMEYFNSIWFRASDLRTDEYGSLKGAPEKEINPMLGFHGIRFSLKYPEILKAELKAMKKIASKNPQKKIGIMFPQVISIEEVKEAKKYFEEVRLDNMEFGVMIETPAAVQIIDDICEEVDFISFGTNDLTQYTLAVDRNNEDVQYLYNEMHPAIFSQIEKVLDACKEKDIETSICGQAGSKKEMVDILFKKGIKSISVNADAAYDISNLIKKKEETERLRLGDEEKLRKENEEKKKYEEEREKLNEERRQLEEERKKLEEERLRRERLKIQESEEEKQRLIEDKRGSTIPDVEKKIVQEEKSEDFEGTEEELQRLLKKFKRQRKWKEFNKLKRKIKKEYGWNKKAVLGTLNFDESGEQEKVKPVEKKPVTQEQKIKEETIKKNNNLLNKERINAEIEEFKEEPEFSKAEPDMTETEENIEPFGDTERIDERIEDIQEEVQEENQEDIQEDKEISDNIEVSEEEIEEPENEEDDGEQESEEEYRESEYKGLREVESEDVKKDDLDYDEILDKVEENEERFGEPEEDILDITKEEPESKPIEEETPDYEDEETSQDEEDTGSVDEDDIGVYNPDDVEDNKQRYKYNFNDW